MVSDGVENWQIVLNSFDKLDPLTVPRVLV